MPRRALVLCSLLAASAGVLLATGSHRSVLALIPQEKIEPLAVETRIEDRNGSLDAARRELENLLGEFARDLGIGVRVVVTAGAEDPAVLASDLLARSEETPPWDETGQLLVLIDGKRREVHVATTESLAAVLPETVSGELLTRRLLPFVGHPLVGVALASGLARVQNHLLDRVLAGDLAIGETVARFSAVERLARDLPALDARCRAQARAPGETAESSVEAFVCALARGIAPADAELFTAASRFQLARRPLAGFESRTRAMHLEQGRPWTVSVVGERAAIRSSSERDGSTSLPVLLVREAGLWRVDVVEMEKAYRATSRGRWVRRNASTPYFLALGDPAMKGEVSQDLTPVELWGEPLADVVARLERSETPEARIRLAEILLRNAWLPGEALVHWDEALANAQDYGNAGLFADRAELIGYPLLGAIALAPFGPTVGSRVGELLVKSGKIESGVAAIQNAIAWRRAAREAARAAAGPQPVRSI